MSFANLSNVAEIEELYKRYLLNKESVEPSWRYFFEGMEFSRGDDSGTVPKALRIGQLIYAFRTYGHLAANVDPITKDEVKEPRELSLSELGFKSEEMKELFPTLSLMKEPQAPLETIIATLKEIYCGAFAVEYMSLQSPEMEKWLQEEIEPRKSRPLFTEEKKKEILHQLNKATLFEIFLHTKYVGQKRFSLEGGETLIPLLHEIVEKGGALGVEEFVVGMAHRGRLNVLTNILGKSYSMVFGEFEDEYDELLSEGTGDVKYHKGFSADVKTSHGQKVHISLTSNASHLESVDPIVEGKTRAKQDAMGDESREHVAAILIHGDGAIAGQGVVYETLQFYKLKGYATGGTIHIIINNQIGFTTLPEDERSTRYCTDIARAFSAPVFHVNAEDPEACVFAGLLAIELRQRFKTDVFIDLNCYRKYGHNESDEPAFTQPLEYQIIRAKKTIREIYRDELIKTGAIEKQIVEGLEKDFQQQLHHELEELKIKKEAISEETFGSPWDKYPQKKETTKTVTKISKEKIQELGAALTRIPEGFELHPKIEKLNSDRKKMSRGEQPIDWGMGEALAFASLVEEGHGVRLAGQDSCRGTFSQRHAIWVDQKTSKNYYPLQHLGRGQAKFECINSPISEFAALGFEFGYSLANPETQVIWEAQYGDFANGGQVIIDQYIAASEQKWKRYSGIVLLLPHGYEGQGPEHSSARLERYLQLCGHHNMSVVAPTTPAQYFHLLRRQVKRPFRKPLIVMTPKGLLRHPWALSTLEDFSSGFFQEMIPEPDKSVKRLILMSGRIYYDLLYEKEKRSANDVGLFRIEELYPLDESFLKKHLESYSDLKEIVWVQEEPENMGARSYIFPILQRIAPSFSVVARPASAATAHGSHKAHVKEHQTLMDLAFRTQKHERD